jgi:hypothetical protein
MVLHAVTTMKIQYSVNNYAQTQSYKCFIATNWKTQKMALVDDAQHQAQCTSNAVKEKKIRDVAGGATKLSDCKHDMRTSTMALAAQLISNGYEYTSSDSAWARDVLEIKRYKAKSQC